MLWAVIQSAFFGATKCLTNRQLETVFNGNLSFPDYTDIKIEQAFVSFSHCYHSFKTMFILAAFSLVSASIMRGRIWVGLLRSVISAG